MEKVELNNQIVIMRKHVKQAKVYIMNKLVKQAKLLQKRKGNEVQIQKAKRKAERFLKEITVLKKTKIDDVSKLALAKARNWKSVLEQKNTALDHRCIAMLANHQVVQKEVEAFYNSNKELASKAKDLIKWDTYLKKQWDKKDECSKNSAEHKIDLDEKLKYDRNFQKPNTKINAELSCNWKNRSNTVIKDNQTASNQEEIKQCLNEIRYNENNPPTEISKNMASDFSCESDKMKDEDNDTDGDANNNKSHFQQKNMELNKSNILNPEESVMVFQSEFDMDLLKTTVESEHSSSKDLAKTMEDTDSYIDEELEYNDSEKHDIKITQNKHIKLHQSDLKKIDNGINTPGNKLKAIKQLNLDELEGCDEIPLNNAPEKDQFDEGSIVDVTIETSQKRRNDPFFLGCGAEESDVEESDVEEKITNFPKNNIYTSKYSSFSNFSKEAETEKGTYFKRKEPNHNPITTFKSFSKDKFKAGNYQNEFVSHRNSFDKNNKRHQNDFKMKGKIRERIHEKSTKIDGNKFSAKSKELHKKDNASDKPLHPSWEAKRKQKELTNASFQGKRVVFDD